MTNVYTAGVNNGYYLNWIPVENKDQVYSQLISCVYLKKIKFTDQSFTPKT